jgi:hypothetical protein
MTDEERTERERLTTSDVELHSLETETEEPTGEELTESAEDEVEGHMTKPRAGT